MKQTRFTEAQIVGILQDHPLRADCSRPSTPVLR